MARKLITIAALAASVATALVPATAMAHDHYGNGWGYGRYQNDDGDGGWYRHQRDGDRGYDRRDYGRDDREGYASNGYYADQGYRQAYYARPQYSYRCHSDGTTGAIIGALAGGLLGNGLAGRGDRALGTILGGGAGALAGRAIDRSGNHC